MGVIRREAYLWGRIRGGNSRIYGTVVQLIAINSAKLNFIGILSELATK